MVELRESCLSDGSQHFFSCLLSLGSDSCCLAFLVLESRQIVSILRCESKCIGSNSSTVVIFVFEYK